MDKTINEKLITSADEINVRLAGYFQDKNPRCAVIYDAAAYSLNAGGKRIRPFLVTEFSRLFGGKDETATAFACALEMIHTYSLIHDDLPCMDNDDYRRSKLTNHKVFGEDMALLAGDALLTAAFGVAAGDAVPDRAARYAAKLLSNNAGIEGMIGGQVIDLLSEKTTPDLDTLLMMHEKKTAALIEAGCLLGCYSAGIFDEASPEIIAARAYAHGIGLTFQIIDDLLDRYGDAAVLGKATGSDEANGKTTFLSFMNEADARTYADTLTRQAIDAIKPFPGSETLIALAQYLLNRDR